MTTLSGRTAVSAVSRTVVYGAVTLMLVLGVSGCSATIDVSSVGPGEGSEASIPESASSADPHRISIPSTAPAPIVERHTVGAAAPGVIEQLTAINTTISFDYPSTLVQAAWRENDLPHAQIILQGEVPDSLWTLLENAPLRIEVALPNGPTLDESNAVLSAMMDVVRATGRDTSAGGSYDTLTGVYSFSYSAPQPIDPADFAALTGGAAIDLWYAGTEPVAEAL